MLSRAITVFFAGLSVLVAHAAAAETYPSKSVRVVVPYPPGSGLDTVARVVADRLQARFKQTFVVDNRSGGSGNIGSEYVFRAAPDGYTLLVAPPTPLVVNKALLGKLSFDPDQFTPVSTLASLPNVLLVHPSVPAKSAAELIAYARANPDKLNYASQGVGATPHLAAELLKTVTKVQMVHVPFRGVAPAIQALIAGNVQLMFADLATALPQIQGNKVRALAVTSEARNPLLPDVPTLAETLPGFSSITWYGMVAPPQTPQAISELLAAAIAEEMKNPRVVDRLKALSISVVADSPAAMGAFMAREREKWGKVIQQAGLKPAN